MKDYIRDREREKQYYVYCILYNVYLMDILINIIYRVGYN